MEWHPHNEIPDDYGRRTGVIVSLVIHGLALGGMIWASLAGPERERPLNAMTVRLGGPQMMQAGKARKAPVAGVVKKKDPPPPRPKPKPVPEKKPAVKQPVKQEGALGLNREKKPVAKPPKKADAEPAPEPDIAPPEPQPRETVSQEGARAMGGIQGDAGTGVSMQIGDGSETVSDESPEFLSYFRTVMAKVSSRWTKSGLEEGSASVRFRIQRNGSVQGVEVVRSAGRSYLDGPAKRAVLGADLPPLPQGYQGDELIVTLNFHYGAERR